MSYGNTVTIVGNLTRDPELRFTQTSIPVVNFGVAWNQPKGRDGEEKPPNFFDVVAWRDLAENVAESLGKGTRVVVTGRLQYQSWEKDGQKHSKVEILADEIAPSLRWATCEVVRNARDGGPTQTPRFADDEAPF